MADNTIILITGANTGIGLEAVKSLIQSSKEYTILLGSRDLSKGKAAVAGLQSSLTKSESTVDALQIDVSDDVSIQAAVDHVGEKYGRLDVLVNNAGASFDKQFTQDVTNFRQVFNKAYDVNVTGAQVTTASFAPLLIKSSNPRLIFLTSGLSTLNGTFEGFIPPSLGSVPNPKGGWPKEGLVGQQGYKASKAALNMCMLTWHWILKEDGVKTFAISPGFLATNLGGLGPDRLRSVGAKDPAQGGDIVRKVVEGERDGDVGKVVSQDGVQPF